MKIDHEFVVPAPVDRAWEVLTDLELIAPCMPGAVLTGSEGDTYSGKLKVKVGPVVSEFAGTATFVTKDAVHHVAVIDAKARDARGAGNASATITARLRADGDSTVATVETDMKISGKLAQFGSGMIKEVSAKLLDSFVTCLKGKIEAAPDDAVPAAVLVPAEVPAAQVPVPAEVAVAAEPAVAAPLPAATPAVATPVVATPVVATPAVATEPEALDLMALAGGSLRKRLIPVAIVAGVVVVGVIIYVVVR